MRQTLIALVVVALVVVLAVGSGMVLYMATRDSQRQGGLRADSSPITASPNPDASDVDESSDTSGSPDDVSNEGGDDEDEPEAHPVRIYGTVTVAATGAPVAGATILSPDGGYEEEAPEDSDEEVSSIVTGIKAVMDAFSEETLEVQTDDSGAYELTVSSEGATLLCSAQGFASAQFDFYDPELTEKRLDFRLVPEATLSGRVMDDQGKGVGGVLIYMEDIRSYDDVPGFGWGGPYEELVSLEDGTYSVVGLPPGNYQLSADAETAGYIVDEQNCPILNVGEGEHVAGVDIHLTTAGTVTGTVRDGKGNPIFEASITAVFEQGPVSPLTTFHDDFAYGSSNEDGVFEVRPVRFDRDFRLHVEHEDYVDIETGPMRLSATESATEVALVLDSGSRVSGVAVDVEGRPAKESMLVLEAVQDSSAATGRRTESLIVETDDGSFAFAHVAQGTYELSGSKTPQTLEVRAGEDISGLRVVADKSFSISEILETPELEGVVIGSDGEPRDEVEVELLYTPSSTSVESTVTLPDGTFTFAGLTRVLDHETEVLGEDSEAQPGDGTFEVRATSEEGIAWLQNVHRGDKVTLRLQPAASVAGNVVDAQGQPVPYCDVTLVPADSKPAPSRPPLMRIADSEYLDRYTGEILSETDDSGEFEFTPVDNGTYSVVAMSKAQGAGESQTFAVAKAVSPGNLTITLQKPVSFSGIVTGPDGRPLPGATVELYRAEGTIEGLEAVTGWDLDDANGADMSDVDGAFEVCNLPHGLYSVRATHPDYAPFVQHEVEIARGRDVSGYVISLTRGGSLHGVVSVPSGEVPNASISLYGEEATVITFTDAQGRFEIAGLPAGVYALSSYTTAIPQAEMEDEPSFHSVTIVDGQVTEIAIRVGADVDVAGTVGGQLPEGQVWVCLLKEEGGQDSAALDEDRIAILALSKSIRKVGADGSFELKRVEPGTYTVLVAVTESGLNLGMADGAAALAESLTQPAYTEEVTIGTEPVTLDIEIQ